MIKPWVIEALFLASEIVLLISYLPTRILWLRIFASITDVGFMVSILLIGLDASAKTIPEIVEKLVSQNMKQETSVFPGT